MTDRLDKRLERSASLTPIQRAEDLLHKMTIEEKAMQLSCLYPMALLGAEGPIRSQLDAQLRQGIGHIAGLGTLGHKTPETIARTVNAIQAISSRRPASRSRQYFTMRH
jgi:beta-glucosidase